MGIYTINEKFRAVPAPGDRPPSDRQARLAEMFGLGLDDTYEVTLYENLALDVRPGDLVFITGPSGSGKSVLLRRLTRALRDAQPDGGQVVDLSRLRVRADRPVIDLPAAPLETALRLLSAAGLADAFALLRPASQLSDGQRYRLRLALALDRLLAGADAPGGAPASAQAGAVGDDRPLPRPARTATGATDCSSIGASRTEGTGCGSRPAGMAPASILVADEFCSTLDRLCARALAYRVRRLVDRYGLTVLAASAHDDLVEDLAPDVLVVQREAAGVSVRYADTRRSANIDPSLPVGASQNIDPSLPVGASHGTDPSLPVGASQNIDPSLPVGASQNIDPSLPVRASQGTVPREGGAS